MTALRLSKPKQEAYEGRLPGARRAHHPGGLTVLKGEREVLKQGSPVRVSEV